MSSLLPLRRPRGLSTLTSNSKISNEKSFCFEFFLAEYRDWGYIKQMVDALALEADEGRVLNHESVGKTLCSHYQPAVS